MWKLNEINQFTILGQEGQQACTTVSVATVDQFITSSGAGYSVRTQAVKSMFSGNPYQKITNAYTGSGNVSDDQDALRLINIKKKFHICNAVSVGAITLKVLVVKCQNNGIDDFITIWQNQLYFEGNTVGLGGGAQQTVASAATAGYGAYTDV